MFKCIGCDNQIPWDGLGLFCYTCPCGASIFYNEETGQVTMPGSVVIGISMGRTTPHLGDLVGESDYISPIKERLIAELREKGFIRMDECEQCQKDGTLKRKQDMEKRLALMEAERIISQDQSTKGGNC